MEQDEMKRKIWGLDDFLECFSGMDWVHKVGDVARLKSLFFGLPEKSWPQCKMLSRDSAKLRHYFAILSDDNKSGNEHDTAFYGAVSELELILTRMNNRVRMHS